MMRGPVDTPGRGLDWIGELEFESEPGLEGQILKSHIQVLSAICYGDDGRGGGADLIPGLTVALEDQGHHTVGSLCRVQGTFLVLSAVWQPATWCWGPSDSATSSCHPNFIFIFQTSAPRLQEPGTS